METGRTDILDASDLEARALGKAIRRVKAILRRKAPPEYIAAGLTYQTGFCDGVREAIRAIVKGEN